MKGEMNKERKPRKMFRVMQFLPLVLTGLACTCVALAAPPPQEAPHMTSRPGFAGDASCSPCHRDLNQSYQHTPHHLTSQLPTASSVKGRFEAGANSLTIVDTKQSPAEPGLRFVMESKKEGFFVEAFSGWDSHIHQRAERIDLVTGSGTRGQTYLYWQGDRLYELPVSYWSDRHQWINSPGYFDGTADFSRPVYPACLECHSAYIRALSSDPKTNRYDKESLVPGISCESCHGPGAEHVRQQSQRGKNAAQSPDSSVLNPAHFSRDRQVDLCAECHNGIQREGRAKPFSYVPGQPLRDYFTPIPSPPVAHPDVHGNQVELLQRSKCYLSSPQFSCTTCHDVHSTGMKAASYSSKCLGCHQWQSCGASRTLGTKIAENCIDCHMPVEETSVIVSQTAGRVVHATMRNHWIKVYANSGNSTAPENAPHP